MSQLIIEQEKVGTLKLHDQLIAKIMYNCSLIHNREWSGVLFYKHNGDWDNLEIEAVDMLLLDLGEPAFTQFNVTADIMHYMVMNDLMEYHVGLIHSHQGFAAFFSGTDQRTLIECGTDESHFLSLIVNNKLDMVAMFTKRVECEIKATKKVCIDGFTKKTEEIVDKQPHTTVEVIAKKLNIELSDFMFDHVTTMSTLLATEAVRMAENSQKQPLTVKDVQNKIYQPTLFAQEYPYEHIDECEIDDEYGDVYFDEINEDDEQ
jgi:proteasome lid subunit RPN8/RPN11